MVSVIVDIDDVELYEIIEDAEIEEPEEPPHMHPWAADEYLKILVFV